jgi:hypothetical protein
VRCYSRRIADPLLGSALLEFDLPENETAFTASPLACLDPIVIADKRAPASQGIGPWGVIRLERRVTLIGFSTSF